MAFCDLFCRVVLLCFVFCCVLFCLASPRLRCGVVCYVISPYPGLLATWIEPPRPPAGASALVGSVAGGLLIVHVTSDMLASVVNHPSLAPPHSIEQWPQGRAGVLGTLYRISSSILVARGDESGLERPQAAVERQFS